MFKPKVHKPHERDFLPEIMLITFSFLLAYEGNRAPSRYTIWQHSHEPRITLPERLSTVILR